MLLQARQNALKTMKIQAVLNSAEMLLQGNPREKWNRVEHRLMNQLLRLMDRNGITAEMKAL